MFGISRRPMHDGFAALNMYKDAAAAPKELVRPPHEAVIPSATDPPFLRLTAPISTSLSLQDDADYPDWLWRIQDPLPTKEELLREASEHYARGGYDELFERMAEADMKRLFRPDARERIQTENLRRKGGTVVETILRHVTTSNPPSCHPCHQLRPPQHRAPFRAPLYRRHGHLRERPFRPQLPPHLERVQLQLARTALA